MGAFLSGEDVARKQDVQATYLSQSDAVNDYVRKLDAFKLVKITLLVVIQILLIIYL